MRTSALVLSPFLLFLSPVLLLVALSFSTVAVVTSILALSVICIRLGFLVAEFSGGVVFDLLSYGVHKYLLSPLSFLFPTPANTTSSSDRLPVNSHANTSPSSPHTYTTPLEPSHNYISSKKRYSSTHKRRGSRKNLWEKDALTEKLGAEGLERMTGDGIGSKNKNKKELLDGLRIGSLFDIKRPLSRRSVSGYM